MKEYRRITKEIERMILKFKENEDGILLANLIILETVGFRTSKSIARREI